MVEGLELAPRVRNLAPYSLRAGSDYCSIRANPAHASSGVVLLQQLITHNSYGTFSKSVDVLKNILQRALENNKSGLANSFNRQSALFRDLVATVPGVEQILEAAGFVQSQNGLKLALESNANTRLLRNRLAELEASDAIRKHRLRSTNLDEMIENSMRHQEQRRPELEGAQFKGVAADLHHDDLQCMAVCVKTLEIIIRNVLKHPDAEKYRKMSLTNERLKKEVLPAPGGLAYLTSVGFVLNPEGTHLVLPRHTCFWKLRAALNALEQLSVNSVYKQFARAAEQEGLLALQTEEELLYEMMGEPSPPPLGQESSRNYRLWHHLEAPLDEVDAVNPGSPTLAEVQHVLGIDNSQKLSVEDRMELRRKKRQLVDAYESALRG